MLESTTLRAQAASNTKEQFSNSPDLGQAMVHAIIDALDAHTAMSTQALNSQEVMNGLKQALLGPARLYESLRGQ
jgi:type I restriction enzyme R subunit